MIMTADPKEIAKFDRDRLIEEAHEILKSTHHPNGISAGLDEFVEQHGIFLRDDLSRLLSGNTVEQAAGIKAFTKHNSHFNPHADLEVVNAVKNLLDPNNELNYQTKLDTVFGFCKKFGLPPGVSSDQIADVIIKMHGVAHNTPEAGTILDGVKRELEPSTPLSNVEMPESTHLSDYRSSRIPTTLPEQRRGGVAESVLRSRSPIEEGVEESKYRFLVSALGSPDSRVSKAAYDQLTYAPESPVDALREGLQDNNPRIVFQCLELLYRKRELSDSDLPRIMDLANWYPTEDIILDALHGFTSLPKEALIPIFTLVAKAGNSDRAADLLDKVTVDQESTGTLAKIISTNFINLAGPAFDLAMKRNLRTPELTEAILSLLKEDLPIRNNQLGSIYNYLKGEELDPKAIRILTTKIDLSRNIPIPYAEQIFSLLAQCGSSEATESLKGILLNSQYPWSAALAAESLAKSGESGVVALKSIQESTNLVRRAWNAVAEWIPFYQGKVAPDRFAARALLRSKSDYSK